VTHHRYLLHVLAGNCVLKSKQVPGKVFLENRYEIPQQFAIVIQASEQFQQVDTAVLRTIL